MDDVRFLSTLKGTLGSYMLIKKRIVLIVIGLKMMKMHYGLYQARDSIAFTLV